MKTEFAIMDTDITINWLPILNNFIGGITTGAGFMLVVILVVLFVNRGGKKK